MHLSTRQAGDQLGGISEPTVAALIRQGLLTDMHPDAATGRRHNYRLDSDQVTAFGRTYRVPAITRRKRAERAQAVSRTTNGSGTGYTTSMPLPIPANFATPSIGPGRLASVEGKLDALTAKVDRLLAVWA